MIYISNAFSLQMLPDGLQIMVKTIPVDRYIKINYKPMVQHYRPCRHCRRSVKSARVHCQA